MTWRSLLLRAYPRGWREEYGDELAGILAQRTLTVRLVLDILGAAAKQRLYRALPWPLCAVALMLRLFVLRFALFDRSAFLWAYLGATFLILFGAGAWAVRRKGSGVWKVAGAAAKAGLAGEIPTAVLYLLTLPGAESAEQHLIYTWMVKTLVLDVIWAAICGLAGAVAARGHAIFLRGLRSA
jgi:hypothetical protein